MKQTSQQQMRIWGMLCHLSAVGAWVLVIYLVVIGIPLFLPLNVIAPFVVWKYKRAQYPWIDFQGKESINFQMSLTLYTLIFIIISLCIVFITGGLALISNSIFLLKLALNCLLTGLFLLTLFALSLQLFVVNFAAMKAYKGEHYRYPFTIRFLR